MNIRAFGWIQNPADFSKLKLTVQVFDNNSAHYSLLRDSIIEEVIAFDEDKERFLSLLENNVEEFNYSDLVGTSRDIRNKPTGVRSKAVANSLLQVTILPQNANTSGKRYTDNWTADGFLRWAVSFNFVDFDRETDMFRITELGRSFSESEDDSEEELNILRRAILSYPPATQVLSILAENQNWHTKFYIGNRLGFIGERGFTSYGEDLMINWISNSDSRVEIQKVKNDIEGTSDKYARMIAGWLKKVGFVTQRSVRQLARLGMITGFPEYRITGSGLSAYNRSVGSSINNRQPKFVMWEFFATTVDNKNYVRTRRAYILEFSRNGISFNRMVEELRTLGFNDPVEIFRNDIDGLNTMGLRISQSNNRVQLLDLVVEFTIPDLNVTEVLRNEVLENKKAEFLRDTNLSPRFIELIEIAHDGKRNRDFEIISLELFQEVYGFDTLLMGGGRKPDGIIFTDDYGVIVDTKAYGDGYSKSISQEDEMVRYIVDNKDRSVERNSNEWWNGFPSTINENSFYYLWISSKFIGQFSDQLLSTYQRTGVSGGALNVEQLLWGADAVMKGELNIDSIPSYMNNTEITWN